MDFAMNGVAGKPWPQTAVSSRTTNGANTGKPKQQRSRRKKDVEEDDPSKRRCVSTACIACRKRKSKCDGNLPACAACSQVYGTDCIYDPNSDHRRKGVYKNDADTLKTKESTLQTIIHAILNYAEEDVPDLVQEIRTCESLDAVADKIVAKENGEDNGDDGGGRSSMDSSERAPRMSTFESHLYGKMGDLRLDEGSVRYIGGTSHLIHAGQGSPTPPNMDEYLPQENAITSWTNVTDDPQLVLHLLNMYFTWHYTFFTLLSKQLFFRDFTLGRPPPGTRRKTQHCTPLLVNAILALGCHFTSHAGARVDPEDSATAGDHFFREAKRLIMENDEHEKPSLTTVQALALMSVREAGCGREAKGWVYSGMSFRMACDMGLNLDSSSLSASKEISGDDDEEDNRKVTFWGCYLIDKCWSNYMGRLPQLPSAIVAASKYDVFPEEDSSQWSPYTDSGFTQAHAQPARTRAVALQISKLCDISNDLMAHFYNPIDMEKTRGKAAELRKLSAIHTRLESWRRDLPKEFEPKEGVLSSVLVMHMFFQLLFIHLFRPFLKYTQATSPLPSTVSPRKLCTQAAAMISKLMRLYKRSHGLRQICNIAVYIAHSACTIHLLNLPDKNAKRDIVHGVKHLEEIAESWLCARRTLAIMSMLATKWKVDLPDEAAAVLARTDAKFSSYHREIQSPASSQRRESDLMSVPEHLAMQPTQTPALVQPTTAHNSPLYNTASPMFVPAAIGASGSAIFPSAATTPATPQNQARQHSTRAGASPSDMFGGVEQLLRDSHDWAYRDQAQFATGFGNWNSTPDADTAAWAANMTPNAPLAGSVAPARQHSQASAVSIPMNAQPAGYVPTASATLNGANGVNVNGTGNVDGMMTNWLNSMTAYNTMATTYNEDEWYQ
ncbi:unnamed protein product [Zymoseptoria tritici ST99CH_1A5]|uniref:Zn(2)-C6 fungal-type domain-containing protein n=1 Tax=Zymoseptoria tritici ST99CH_1A5 TaxID=1276529 RepID=A0A1Y6LT64_ZYMTR|nr:unnamed protein product [Zymoseptoria tritici ST99CH_1A5]